jgi:hypothetical protein
MAVLPKSRLLLDPCGLALLVALPDKPPPEVVSRAVPPDAASQR